MGVSEAEPFIAKPVKQPPGPPPREWKGGHLLNFVGDAEAVDVASCCLAAKFPFVAFGWNSSRALRKSFWLEALAFLLSLVALGAAGHAAFCMVLASFCGKTDPTKTGAETHPMMGHGDMHHDHSSMMDDYHRHGMHGSDKHLNITSECMEQAAPYLAMLGALMLAIMAMVVYWAASRRQAIREQFGIQGSFMRDLAAWACCSCCALTQETRTLLHNNVHGGLWHGPLPMAMPPTMPAMGTPAAQHMV